MIEMLKRHEVQVLRRAGHTWKEIAVLSGVSVRTVRRIAAETEITTIDNAAERVRREVGRPSTADAYRDVLVKALTEEPTLRTVVKPASMVFLALAGPIVAQKLSVYLRPW